VIGPHRRVDWTRVELGPLEGVRTPLDATVDDVALACVAGALRRFLLSRSVDVDRLDLRARLVRSGAPEPGRSRTRVATSRVQLPLPLHEEDPHRRLRRIVEGTLGLEQAPARTGPQARSLAGARPLSELLPPALTARLARLGSPTARSDLVVTHVAGSEGPAYLLGARLLEVYPLPPLPERHSLGVAFSSYGGALCWGINSDWDLVPDLHDFIEELQAEAESLHKGKLSSAAGGDAR
jgi:hypothetical protein